MSKSILLACLLISAFVSVNVFAYDHTHAKWTKVLSENVVTKEKTTQVKYLELLKNTSEINSYLKDNEAVTQVEYSSWNEKQKLAFLFNTYNAETMKLILNELEKNKNLKSIKKIGGLFGNPWKIKFFNLFGKESYLDEIEQEMARKNFDEPRMHFAFNCASIGCPSLQMSAFTADKLDEQLDQAAVNFLKDKSRNELDTKKKTLALSSILKWYKDDFENSKKLGPLKNFLVKYFPFSIDEKKDFENGRYVVKYLDYDWNLNTWRP